MSMSTYLFLAGVFQRTLGAFKIKRAAVAFGNARLNVRKASDIALQRANDLLLDLFLHVLIEVVQGLGARVAEGKRVVVW